MKNSIGSSHARRLVSQAKAEDKPKEEGPISAEEHRQNLAREFADSRAEVERLRTRYQRHYEEARRYEKKIEKA